MPSKTWLAHTHEPHEERTLLGGSSRSLAYTGIGMEDRWVDVKELARDMNYENNRDRRSRQTRAAHLLYMLGSTRSTAAPPTLRPASAICCHRISCRREAFFDKRAKTKMTHQTQTKSKLGADNTTHPSRCKEPPKLACLAMARSMAPKPPFPPLSPPVQTRSMLSWGTSWSGARNFPSHMSRHGTARLSAALFETPSVEKTASSTLDAVELPLLLSAAAVETHRVRPWKSTRCCWRGCWCRCCSRTPPANCRG